MWKRVTILGTGLIGGSFALAARGYLPGAKFTGWDRPGVLTQAAARGAIDEAQEDLAAAIREAELVYVALPIGSTLNLLPEIARRAAPDALVTDACSTKAEVCRAAEQHFRGRTRFLGGHPMAGREKGGIENADGQLFRGAKYALAAAAGDSDDRVRQFAALVAAMGAAPVWLDAETHDWAVAIISQLPQLAAVALARVVNDETDETGLPLLLAGPGARDALRLAGSPYDIWRDIALTNRENLSRALDRLAQAVEHLRNVLASRELKDEFETANRIYQILREVK
jgi:prephenate dehydrogenase